MDAGKILWRMFSYSTENLVIIVDLHANLEILKPAKLDIALNHPRLFWIEYASASATEHFTVITNHPAGRLPFVIA
jgi:hypothetical protein